MRGLLPIVLTLIALLAPAVVDGAEIAPALQRALDTGWIEADGLLPVLVIPEVETSPALEALGAGLPASERRVVRLAALRQFTAVAQRPVLEYLLDQQRNNPATVTEIYPLVLINAVAARVRPSVIDGLAELSSIERLSLSSSIDDALCGSAAPADLVWNINHVDADVVWEEPYGYTGAGVVAAVIDTGCDIEHPDLADHPWTNPDEVPGNGADDDGNGYADDYYGWDFYYNNNDILGPVGGHGSHVAGTVAGDGNGGLITGMAPDVLIMSLQAFSDTGSTTEYIVWRAMDYAVIEGADVINCSWGWRQYQTDNQDLWREGCENSLALGVTLCVAAGNEGDDEDHPPPDNVRTPGDVPGVITVGATNSYDDVVGFSSRGPVEWSIPDHEPPYDDWPYPPGLVKPDISAPGVGIQSIDGRTGGYRYLQGTSMATPHLTGAVALLLEALPELTPQELKDYLESSSLDIGEAGKDNDAGSGRLNALAALVLAQTGLRFTDLAAADAPAGIILEWELTRHELVSGYRVWRRVDSGDWEALTATPISTRRYLDRDTTWHGLYEYRIEAQLVDGGSISAGPVGLVYGDGFHSGRPVLGHPHPSPTAGPLSVPVILERPATIALELYDLAGRRVRRYEIGELTAGRHSVSLTLEGLSAGVYLLGLNDGTVCDQRPLAVMP